MAQDNPFIERMRAGGVLWDGASGTLLIANGLQPGAPPQEWNRTRTQIIVASSILQLPDPWYVIRKSKTISAV